MLAILVAARSAGSRAPIVTSHVLGARPIQFAGVPATTYHIANAAGRGSGAPRFSAEQLGNTYGVSSAPPVNIRRCGAGYLSPAQVIVAAGTEVAVRCEENILCSLHVSGGAVVVSLRDMRIGLSGY